MNTCYYLIDNMCHNEENLTTHCCGFPNCRFIRNAYRSDIAMEMRHNIMIDVDAFQADWDMLAEYFTNK